MPDQSVVLEKNQWQALLNILGTATGPGISWTITNPLLMAIGAQLQKQEAGFEVPDKFPGDGLDADPPDIGLQQAARRVPRN